MLGRRDLQVKLNGERIELGEVEQLLGTCPLVAQCVAVPWGGALLAHVVLDGEEMDGLVALALAAHCDRHLPRIMRPRRFVAADALPLTANGKVNRAALPTVPPPGPSARASHEPLTELEEAVAIAWASELSLPDGLGADSDFYSLGGGSVQAVRVTRVLRAVLHGGGGGKPRWAEGASDWRDPAGDAALFLPPERAGDAECHFGLCDGGPFAPCALLERPVLRHYAQFLVGCGVRVAETAETAKATRENAEHAGAPEIELSPLPRALETAIRAGRETLARALLWAGCSLSQSGPGPLHWAASRCSDSLVRLLVRHRANVLQLGLDVCFFSSFLLSCSTPCQLSNARCCLSSARYCSYHSYMRCTVFGQGIARMLGRWRPMWPPPRATRRRWRPCWSWVPRRGSGTGGGSRCCTTRRGPGRHSGSGHIGCVLF